MATQLYDHALKARSRVLSSALKHWSSWAYFSSPPKLIKEFDDGLSHACGLIGDARKQAVLKVFNGCESQFEQAVSMQKCAAATGLAPAVIAHTTAHKALLMKYIDRKPWEMNSTALAAIAEALASLHQMPVTDAIVRFGQFNMRDYCLQYLDEIGQRGAIGIWAKQQHAKLEQQLLEFDHSQAKSYLCHNDLVAANILLRNNEVTFIDWEYAQLNSPWFDLAAVIFYLNLN